MPPPVGAIAGYVGPKNRAAIAVKPVEREQFPNFDLLDRSTDESMWFRWWLGLSNWMD
jgi:hypothetical protein